MLTYQVWINIDKSNGCLLIVQGKINKINQVKMIMEIEFENYSDIKPVHNPWLVGMKSRPSEDDLFVFNGEIIENSSDGKLNDCKLQNLLTIKEEVEEKSSKESM